MWYCMVMDENMELCFRGFSFGIDEYASCVMSLRSY